MSTTDQVNADIPRPTRGLKNRNPGNIRFVASVPWQGQTGQDSVGFAVFDTDVNGLRAMMIDLHTLFSRLTEPSILTIIATYAPPIENNTKTYADYVSNALKIDPLAVIPDFTPAVATALAQAMVHVEQGVDPYNVGTYDHAAALAFMHINQVKS